MIEPTYCTWCDRVATHGRNGVGDGIYPTCGYCCDNCDERGCDYRMRNWILTKRGERVKFALQLVIGILVMSLICITY